MRFVLKTDAFLVVWLPQSEMLFIVLSGLFFIKFEHQMQIAFCFWLKNAFVFYIFMLFLVVFNQKSAHALHRVVLNYIAFVCVEKVSKIRFQSQTKAIFDSVRF